jgi:hypothetical protein
VLSAAADEPANERTDDDWAADDTEVTV